MSLSISPNYRNLPQFFTSVGVLFIAFSILSQLFSLTYLDREFLIAVNDAHKINVSWAGGFRENSPQQLVHIERVRSIERFQKIVNTGSYLFLGIGLISIVFGLYLWVPLQRKENKLLDLTIKKLEIDIKRKSSQKKL